VDEHAIGGARRSALELARKGTGMATQSPDVWMWQRAWGLLEEAERARRQLFRPASEAELEAVWEPPIDVFETPHRFWVVVALPGVDAEHIQVELDANALLVIGERERPAPCSSAAVRRLEIPHGRFVRRVELAAEPLELVSSTLTHGCLVLEVAHG
jgi:HSP20 family protein